MSNIWGLNAQRMMLNGIAVGVPLDEARKRAPKPTGWQSHTKDRAFHDNHSPGKAKAKRADDTTSRTPG